MLFAATIANVAHRCRSSIYNYSTIGLCKLCGSSGVFSESIPVWRDQPLIELDGQYDSAVAGSCIHYWSSSGQANTRCGVTAAISNYLKMLMDQL